MSSIFRSFGWWWFRLNGEVRGPYLYSKWAEEGYHRALKASNQKAHANDN